MSAPVVRGVPVDSGNVLHAQLPGADFVHACRATVPRGGRSALQAYKDMASTVPGWFDGLMAVRNGGMRLLGMKDKPVVAEFLPGAGDGIEHPRRDNNNHARRHLDVPFLDTHAMPPVCRDAAAISSHRAVRLPRSSVAWRISRDATARNSASPETLPRFS